jgi:methyl-accepting chemotaxis protein
MNIIEMIDGIAFQTNILALNAAVEAARAGDKGRGFAVVAAEVRALAQRSASAAKEIKSLIGGSFEQVENGSRQADAAGVAMKEVLDSVADIARIMNDIAAAAREQAQGIEQINEAISLVGEATQHNAALSEHAAAASESLKDRAARLSGAVAAFKLDEVDSLHSDAVEDVVPAAPCARVIEFPSEFSSLPMSAASEPRKIKCA